MLDADEYLRRAEAAKALAQGARQARDREQLLQIATEWRLLAAEAADAASPSPGRQDDPAPSPGPDRIEMRDGRELGAPDA